MSRDRPRSWPPNPRLNLPSGPPRNVSTQRICYMYGPYQQNLDSTPLQEGQDLGPGRFMTVNVDTDGVASLLHSVNNVVSHQELARQQDGLSSPPEASPVQATSQGDSLERQANVRAESNSMNNNSTARPASTQQGIYQPPVLPQRPQQSSDVNILEVVAVPDQRGRAVNVPPSLQTTVVSQGAEGGCAGFQTLQDPSTSTVVKGVRDVEDTLKDMGYNSKKIRAVQARFGPESMVSAAVFLEYENKLNADSSNDHSSDIAGQIPSERYHTAQSYMPVRDQRVLGTNNSFQRYGSEMEYIILKTSMAETDERERSFQGWPHRSMKLTPQRLADAGLYFTGDKDACRCFSCGGILHRWEDNDDPWVEHARLHPHCSYVRYVKGGLFIDQLRIKK